MKIPKDAKELAHICYKLTKLATYQCDYLDDAPTTLEIGERDSWVIVFDKFMIVHGDIAGMTILLNAVENINLTPEQIKRTKHLITHHLCTPVYALSSLKICNVLQSVEVPF